jgi:hypothetical protein
MEVTNEIQDNNVIQSHNTNESLNNGTDPLIERSQANYGASLSSWPNYIVAYCKKYKVIYLSW